MVFETFMQKGNVVKEPVKPDQFVLLAAKDIEVTRSPTSYRETAEEWAREVWERANALRERERERLERERLEREEEEADEPLPASLLSAEDADTLPRGGWEQQSGGLWAKGDMLLDPTDPACVTVLRACAVQIREAELRRETPPSAPPELDPYVRAACAAPTVPPLPFAGAQRGGPTPEEWARHVLRHAEALRAAVEGRRGERVSGAPSVELYRHTMQGEGAPPPSDPLPPYVRLAPPPEPGPYAYAERMREAEGPRVEVRDGETWLVGVNWGSLGGCGDVHEGKICTMHLNGDHLATGGIANCKARLFASWPIDASKEPSK